MRNSQNGGGGDDGDGDGDGEGDVDGDEGIVQAITQLRIGWKTAPIMMKRALGALVFGKKANSCRKTSCIDTDKQRPRKKCSCALKISQYQSRYLLLEL